MRVDPDGRQDARVAGGERHRAGRSRRRRSPRRSRRARRHRPRTCAPAPRRGPRRTRLRSRGSGCRSTSSCAQPPAARTALVRPSSAGSRCAARAPAGTARARARRRDRGSASGRRPREADAGAAASSTRARATPRAARPRVRARPRNSSAQSSSSGSAARGSVARRSASARAASGASRADRRRSARKPYALAARAHGGEQPGRARRDEHDRGARRRLLEQAQQRVLRLLVQPLGVGDHGDAPAALAGAEPQRVLQRADLAIRTRVSLAPRSTQSRSGWSPTWRSSGPLLPVPSSGISSRGADRRQLRARLARAPRRASQTAARANQCAASRAAPRRPRDQVGGVQPPALELRVRTARARDLVFIARAVEREVSPHAFGSRLRSRHRGVGRDSSHRCAACTQQEGIRNGAHSARRRLRANSRRCHLPRAVGSGGLLRVHRSGLGVRGQAPLQGHGSHRRPLPRRDHEREHADRRRDGRDRGVDPLKYGRW